MGYNPYDITVVVPVGNGSELAREVVAAALRADPPPGEIVVVNDRVTDGSLTGLPRDELVRVVRNDGGPGPAAARNAGVRAARRPIILFIDADVFVPSDFFARVAEAYAGGAQAVLGVEAELPGLPNFASKYKNLWMRFTYLVLPRRVDLFYTSCASIQKEVFQSAGGLDEGYTRPSVEDTAFGRTLAGRGVAVVLEKDLVVEHRKNYRAIGVLTTAFRRGAALARCVLRLGRRRGAGGNRTSVPTSFIASLPFAALFALWVAWAPFEGVWAAGGAGATLLVIYIFNLKWLVFLARRSGGLAAAALAFLPLEVGFSFAGGVWGTVSYYLLRRRY